MYFTNMSLVTIFVESRIYKTSAIGDLRRLQTFHPFLLEMEIYMIHLFLKSHYLV